MKKKQILLGVAAVLVVAAVIGGTWAAVNESTDQQGTMDISAKSLGIDWVEGTEDFDESLQGGVPGDEVPKSYSVTNEAEYDLYTRVTINKYWLDEDLEEPLDPTMIGLYYVDGAEKKPLVKGTVGNGWLIQYDDEEQVVAYYTQPLAPGETTADLMDYLVLSDKMGKEYMGVQLEIAADAEAVQQTGEADVDKAAMLSEWGVEPVMDADGNITGILD